MPTKEFLETFPLYKKLELSLPAQRHHWPKPAIVAPCDVCRGSQTFNMISEWTQYDEGSPRPVGTGVVTPYSYCPKLSYQCAGCGKQRRHFLVTVIQQPIGSTGRMGPPQTEARATVWKVGQSPAWDIRPDPKLAAKLGARVDALKKGLVCESQNYGIGAFAYYRRILEDLIDELLDDIGALVAQEGHAAYQAALAEAKKSHRASDKIEHVVDLVPATLRPGGTNPLAILHGALSQGLHSMPDEDCLANASAIRGALTYLVAQVGEAKASADQFKKDLHAIVTRRGGT